MISYEYLEKMFFRLREAREISAIVAKQNNQQEKHMLRNWECAIEASIRDYLKLHGGASNARD